MFRRCVQNLVIASVIAGSLFSCSGTPVANKAKEMNHTTDVDSPGKLDRTTAYRYALAWAEFEHDDPALLKTASNGDFFGTLGSISFDYSAGRGVLTARATVQPNAIRLVKRPDVVEELHKVERENPKSVDDAEFELTTGRWENDDSEPWLYLR